jgi:multimeric flavodoxin WrbA
MSAENSQNQAVSPVIAVHGSPRKGGNTERLLKRVTDVLAERGVAYDRVDVRGGDITPCLEITKCMTTGRCPIQDDMTPLYDRLLAARAVIVTSPIFFYGAPAQLKALIDRCQALWARKYLLKETLRSAPARGFLIAAGATSGEKLFDGLLLTMKYFFDALDVEFADQVLVRGVDEAGAVEDRPDALADAQALGRRIADFIQSAD